MGRTQEDRFKSAVAAVLGITPEQVTQQLSADSVDTWDSLNQINLIGALEQEFGITLPMERGAAAQSVPALKALLAEHGVAL